MLCDIHAGYNIVFQYNKELINVIYKQLINKCVIYKQDIILVIEKNSSVKLVI